MKIGPVVEARLLQLGRASDLAWAVGATTGLALTLVAAYVPLPPQGGTACAYLGLLVRAGIYLSARRALAGRGGEVIAGLFGMGIVAGVFELVVDWWLVHGLRNGALEYMGPDVVLLASPVWMPLAWACVIVEMGYPAFRLFGILRERLGDRAAAALASIVVGIAAGLTVGFYEVFAFRAGWWQYGPANAMIGSTCALYIPVGELLMFLAVLPIGSRALENDDRRPVSSIVAGAQFAVAIFLGYAIAYAALELGRPVG